MAIPKYDEMTLPILQILGDGAGHSQRNLARKRPRQNQGLAETHSAQTRLSKVE